MSDDTTKRLRGTIQVDERPLQGHVDEVVRGRVHGAIRMTPAMALGITETIWETSELLA